jgi:hypothetical protein
VPSFPKDIMTIRFIGPLLGGAAFVLVAATGALVSRILLMLCAIGLFGAYPALTQAKEPVKQIKNQNQTNVFSEDPRVVGVSVGASWLTAPRPPKKSPVGKR